ncbi:stage III sporulation protein AA [Caldisalinibacter kiritimatiensis]|uniref:Stage III sporulation protein AA n=1 Tax=Caldisalinibacter kiritimatiensis TaxID=1304284 RepID=R1CM24_9FIRM|nr:stage III sporulation protein AA [Caldisalinibacter kiritimatiensis]EOC99760.1 Stage III sporulation protein AA [Caldisalinibacter kiritimatiensis]
MQTHNNREILKKVKKYKKLDDILTYLDPEVANVISKIPDRYKNQVEEIRMRIGKPLMIFLNGEDYFINSNGQLRKTNIDTMIISSKNVYKTFRILSNYSVYAFEEEIKNGFITIKGGHRVGVSGKAVYGKNGLETIKKISSLNIRVAREIKGVSKKVIPYIIKQNNRIYNTLIVSPPQCGKTTLLRDIVRNISNGISKDNFYGVKVGIVDERSEIANMYNGEPQNDVGVRTDVLDGCRKYDGILMLIRAMSPNVIATDEIGDENDIKAIHEALKAGVNIIATIHGENVDDIKTKPIMKKIINEKVFERIIVLDNSKGVGTIKDIIDGSKYNSLLNKGI